MVKAPAILRRAAENMTGVVALRDELANERAQVQYIQETLEAAGVGVAPIEESIGRLEQELFEPGYQRLTTLAQVEFSATALVQMRAICRLFALKNPLIKRGLGLRSAYVWGQGVEITARANGKEPGEQDVQAVIDGFLTDEGNANAVTGSAARERLERALGHDGEIFLAAVTRPMTGGVQLRVILADEMDDPICNPEDRSEPWYYLRRWDERTVDAGGNPVTTPRQRYYPAMGYRPAARPRRIGSVDVQWDTPVLHVAVNQPEGWQRGIPDAYAAIDWANAYREFLTDWARLMRSLSRYAWKATTPGSKAAAVKTRIGKSPSRNLAGEPNEAGATAILPPDVALEAVSKSGATIDAESGRPLAMMVASALGVPVTMLLSDPGQTGARATAETLDQPTELEMQLRRELWADTYRRLLRYVILESVRAPKGTLKGKVIRDQFTGRESVVLAGDTDDTIDIVWPALDQVTPDILVKAIAEAAGVGVLPPEQIARLLLQALGVRDVDAILEQLTDDGEFQYPAPPDIGGAGGRAAAAVRAGTDPAAAGDGGSMIPDPGAEGDGPHAGDTANPDTGPPPQGGGGRGG